ncbi:hypothetical protein C7S18_13150 [Ahniella affigens]|uniref:Phytoene synthase n=1 Tax=Ahniella affigens TaxID=2021234 RepID=A0A2P1PTC5_9GAMM|nr:hypothetical protein [Ahniella affigens]AVP98086.1 hypothetical protein C7S18_13150 [Ahniella affigens]
MTDAAADIAEAWQQRWPALRLAHLFASGGESERGLRWALLVLECAAARFGVSDRRVASQKLQFWTEALDAAARGQARHPLLLGQTWPAATARLPELLHDDLERARPETLQQRLERLSQAVAQACPEPTEALLSLTLLASYYALAEQEQLPLAEPPLALLLSGGGADPRPYHELSSGLARALAPRWNAQPKASWQGRRGQRVLGLETLYWLGSDLFPEFEAGRLSALRRSWRAWRAASGLA